VGAALRIGEEFRFRLHTEDIISPADWADQDDPLFYITARYNRAMERIVRMAPDQYLWIHRRWNSRPKWEREGKPLPERIKAKLRSLPWMTDAEFDRIVADSDRRASEFARSAA
jgi:KDO2-lipid IV(A) lauroyltransferase